MGFSLEQQAWQEFAKWYERLSSHKVLYEGISDDNVTSAIRQAIRARQLHAEWNGGRDEGGWSYSWGHLNGIPTEAVNPQVILGWFEKLEAVANQDLVDDELGQPMLRAALAPLEPLRRRAMSITSALAEAEHQAAEDQSRKRASKSKIVFGAILVGIALLLLLILH
jgi:hypothetical protein